MPPGASEVWVSKGLDPAAEAADAGERDGGLFLAFGQDLEQQLGAALVELQVGRWGEVFGDDVVAAAMIDRLVHYADVVALKGDSYRLKDRDPAM